MTCSLFEACRRCGPAPRPPAESLGRTPQSQARTSHPTPAQPTELTVTLIAALDQRGIRCATTVDGAVNADVFEAFVAQVLVPTLRPGNLVVMDNLSSHKGHRIAELIAAADATPLYLPPYSPDLNPIEMAFSKIKQLLRSLAARSRETLWTGIQPVLDRITQSDALGYFQHAGYTTREK